MTHINISCGCKLFEGCKPIAEMDNAVAWVVAIFTLYKEVKLTATDDFIEGRPSEWSVSLDLWKIGWIELLRISKRNKALE